MPVKFPLPNPRNRFSLKPGSVLMQLPEKASEVEKSSSLTAAIAGARAAANQFNKKVQEPLVNTVQNTNSNSGRSDQVNRKALEVHREPSVSNETEQSNCIKCEKSRCGQTRPDMKRLHGGPAKVCIFSTSFFN